MKTVKVLISVIAALMLAVPMLTVSVSDAVSPSPVQFSGTEYDVTFDLNSSDAHIETTYMRTVDQKISELPVPVWKDHTFAGWYTGNENTSERIYEDHVYTQDTKLYAHWKSDVSDSDGVDFSDPNVTLIIAVLIVVLSLIMFAIIIRFSKR